MKTDENPNPGEKTRPHQYVPEYEELRQRKLGDVPLNFDPKKSILDWNRFFSRGRGNTPPDATTDEQKPA